MARNILLWTLASITAFATGGLLFLVGQQYAATNARAGAPALTLSAVRAERRAYDGAPPVIPHRSLGAACTTCHTETGKEVPHQGFAPANPHQNSTLASATQNCRQCHLFRKSDDLFVRTDFISRRPSLRGGQRLFPGAPPTIPHAVFMRQNCLACHSGPAARPEIRCTHPNRTNCHQCHLSSD